MSASELSDLAVRLERRSAPVSVVLPTCNASATVRRALHSLADQTLWPREVVIVDDASSDGTVDVIQGEASKYPKRWIRLLEMERNRGPASARNAAWQLATQRYVAFLDADDAWHPRKLELQYAWMEAHPDVVLTGHPCTVFPEEMPRIELATLRARPISPWSLLRSNIVSTPSIMLHRDLPQRFETGKRYAEDYLLWLRIVLSGGKAYFLDAPLAQLYKARYGAGGLSADLWGMEKGVLDAYGRLRREGLISLPVYAFLVPYSLMKYVRRLLVHMREAA